MLDATACPSSRPSRTSPAPVSSQDDSIPSTTTEDPFTAPPLPTLAIHPLLQVVRNKGYDGGRRAGPQ
ncbi:hypothetical protein GCM10009801_07430 [Streptomyces albiaxialis]|uniref:Uncharacterized protein n=1 Tax=Streptomyces albiaxialis TaxID=329523 RepID=A0ABN2VJJ1_9ACTN